MTEDRTDRWEAAWQSGDTGWDQGRSPAALDEALEQGLLGSPGRALVPGCGTGYDVFTLARAGFDALGVDLATSARAPFEAARERADAPTARLHIGDFFQDSLPGAPFDLIWDYTFLCAIEPSMREAWASRMAALVRPGGLLATLLFPVVLDDPSPTTSDDPGPPYRLHPDWVAALLEPHFSPSLLRAATQSVAARQGREFLALWRRRDEVSP